MRVVSTRVLPGARAGEDQQRAVHVLHRLPLRGIEGVLELGRRSVDHAACAASGMRIRKLAPFSVGSSVRTPRWASSTTRRESARPMPQPPRLVVIPGSNSVRRISRGDARAVVHHPDLAHALLRSHSQNNRAARPCSASIAFFTSASSAHSSRTASPTTIGPMPRRFELELDRIGPLGKPRPEVARHPVGQGAERRPAPAWPGCRCARSAAPRGPAARRRPPGARPDRRAGSGGSGPARSTPGGW